ncbi:hypothetical protein QNI23_009085 [Bermanella sp. WJH001]|uniref:hypothetical protein n=1 Tax=Bermanella sp. WJH001 TaxID=3048005 RepID=UPI0024BE2FEA|nr:hypothetical protein [Bermanella sp. WJH001]MDJ1537146.1 hypothetical protein [Bermanella sp. WJH001]
MGIWIAMAFIALAIVGSVMWIRPSPRDQKLAKWRREALMAGMKVRLQTLKAEPKNSGIRDDVPGVTYEWFNPEPNKTDKVTWAIVKTDAWLQEGLPQGWSWYGKEMPVDLEKIKQIVETLPVEVNAIERTPVSSRVIWNENGKEFDAVKLKEYLQNLQAIF